MDLSITSVKVHFTRVLENISEEVITMLSLTQQLCYRKRYSFLVDVLYASIYALMRI